MRRFVSLAVMLMSATSWSAGQSSRLVDERNPQYTEVEFVRPEGLVVISRESKIPGIKLQLILAWNGRREDGGVVAQIRPGADPKALHQKFVEQSVQSGERILGKTEEIPNGLWTAFESGAGLVSACCDSRFYIVVSYPAAPQGRNFQAAKHNRVNS
jgi:hypothetical protein